MNSRTIIEFIHFLVNYIGVFAYCKMEIIFKTQNLKDLYIGKEVKIKGFKSNQLLVHQYIKTVEKIIAAPDINTLKSIRSLKLQNLTDDPSGFACVRINRKYRLTIDLIKDLSDNISIISIEEITNHYKKIKNYEANKKINTSFSNSSR